jgi:hypothetical protein
MTDGTIPSQGRDAGQIFQEIVTQEKSGSKARETKETGKIIEGGVKKKTGNIVETGETKPCSCIKLRLWPAVIPAKPALAKAGGGNPWGTPEDWMPACAGMTEQNTELKPGKKICRPANLRS